MIGDHDRELPGGQREKARSLAVVGLAHIEPDMANARRDHRLPDDVGHVDRSREGGVVDRAVSR